MIIDNVKQALRLDGNDLDGEVSDLIEAAKADLSLSGVTIIGSNDPLIKRAVILYCKANFGWDNPEAERFQKSYDLLKMHLTLSTDYGDEV